MPVAESVENNTALVIVKSAEPESDENIQHQNHQHRQLSAHVHGAASMTLSVEQDQLDIAMTISGADAAGFEHTLVTEQDKARLQKALGYLQNPNEMFFISPKAGCELIKGEIATALVNQEAMKNTHADIDISYQWQCKKPAALKEITVHLFSYFSALKKIKSNWAESNKQGFDELTPADRVLKLE